ncbi:Modification methylase AplI [compost metagenome]
MDFSVSERNTEKRENAAAMLTRRLSKDYYVDSTLLHAKDFGVPQNRLRFVLVAVRRGIGVPKFDMALLEAGAKRVTKKWKIPSINSASDAISDYEAFYAQIGPSPDSAGFLSLTPGRARTRYQKAMRDGHRGKAADTRLARHTDAVEARFERIIEICIDGNRSHKSLNSEMRKALGLKKMATRVLDPDRPAPTITSMPDDLLHYREPRTLTVRENARLQSFPDWFKFAGKYTTGGHLRKQEVPRFTQVANAVPPLMAEAIGDSLLRHYQEHRVQEHRVTAKSQRPLAKDSAVAATAS